MSERAKQIALKIIATAWPGRLVTQGMIDGTAAAVERHMLRPHQVRDHVGIIWEQMSDGCYRTLNGAKTDYIDRNFGPLTEVQGETMPDAGEIERLKVRIAELEKRSKELVLSSAEVRGVCGKQKERIAELEKKISEYSRDLIDSKKHVDDLQGWLAEERSISAMRASQLSEMEEDRMSMIETSARLRDLCDRQQKQIAELEKQLADEKKKGDDVWKALKYEQSLSSRRAVQIEKLENELKQAKAEPAKPTAQPEPIWQQIGENEWVYGVPIRGIIWQPIAKVIDGCDWFWHLTDLSKQGHSQNFRDAIEAATVAAEKVLGVK